MVSKSGDKVESEPVPSHSSLVTEKKARAFVYPKGELSYEDEDLSTSLINVPRTFRITVERRVFAVELLIARSGALSEVLKG